MFALKVRSHEARSGPEDIITAEGSWFWVVDEPNGWVEATSSPCNYEPGKVPNNVKTFKTEWGAAEFAVDWKGHPWWCKPDGTFEVVRLKPRMVQDGWEVV
jgi:hypothetical protein